MFQDPFQLETPAPPPKGVNARINTRQLRYPCREPNVFVTVLGYIRPSVYSILSEPRVQYTNRMWV